VFWRQRRYSDQTAHEIDIEVREHVEAARARAVGILRDNREALDEGAALLLAHETLTGDELPKVKTAQAA
jgi:cell division protease FtsH